MSGLVTINGLVKKLIQDVLSVDYSSYKKSIDKKTEAYSLIEEHKFPSSELIQELIEKAIPYQIKFFSYYKDKIERIERIIILLEKGKKRVSQDVVGEYIQILTILRNLKEMLESSFWKSDIITLLEKQKSSLEVEKFGKFLKLFKKEEEKLSGLVGILKSLDINKECEMYPNFSVPQRHAFALKACIALILLVVAGSYVLSLSRDRRYSRGIDEIHASNLQNLLKEYEKKDLEYESQLEKDFQEKYGVEILGKYTELDMGWVNMITSMYGENILKELGVERIIFIPMPEKVKTIKDFEKEARFVVGRTFFDRKTILLVSGASIGSWNTQKIFVNVFLHELSHIIHFKAMEEHTEFNTKWKQIKGGYLDSYQKENIYEDVAVVNERVLMIGVMSLLNKTKPSLQTIDHNPDALNRKIALLKEYNFFPKIFDISTK